MSTDQRTQVAPRVNAEPVTGRRGKVYAYLAAAWSLLYGGLSLGWAIDITGWAAQPFDRVGSQMPPALASALPPYLPAAIALIGAGAAIAMANGWGRSLVRSTLLATAWVISAGLALAFTTEQVLILVGYLPIYLVGAPFGWAPDSFFDHVTWPVVHEAISLLGAGLWAMTALWYRRRRAHDVGGHNTTADVTRRDRCAVAVAVGVPAMYALTRYAWLLGWPLGVTEEFLREGHRSGMWTAGAGLATFAAVGAVLTLGLVQRWGEVLPDRLPFVGGRAVPPALATVPATAVSVLLTAAGLTVWRQATGAAATFDVGTWAASAPVMLLPVWGVALGVATLGYRRRRHIRATMQALSSADQPRHKPGGRRP